MSRITVLAPGLRFVDLQFQRTPRIIATAVLDSPGGVALVDPGPASCLPVLADGLAAGGLAPRDIQAILLTHIHLDHAGATGSLVRDHPHIRVFVHERGAPHMIDPAKLLASATRIYRDAMDTLWGPFLPVPASNVTILTGGERIEVAGRRFDVQYTPGHASHHVSYFEPESGVAFVGDVGGIRLGPTPFVLPPTPPPDIDVELWEASVAKVRAWHPSTLFLTHFGPVDHPEPHLQQVIERLHRNAELARTVLLQDGTDADRAAAFVRELHRDLRRELNEAEASHYELAVLAEHCWMGLQRYWQKRGVAAAPRG
jgi:glyoxylase-like metal-dependent hydrolase (beta-lactamase superfamily II)